MNNKDKKFNEFVGSVFVENDDGWTKEVWDAAWQAALDDLKNTSNKQNPN
jgi:hypothetical protein